MKRGVVSLIAVGVLLTAAPIAAQSPRIDQLQPNIDPSANLALGGAVSDQKLAQTVTMRHDGRVKGLFLPVACSPGTTLIVEIRNVAVDGSPTPEVYARRRVDGNELPSIITEVPGDPNPAFFFKYIRLGGQLRFSRGDQFAITLEVEPPFDNSFTCGINQGPAGNSYPDGQGWYDAADVLPRAWRATSDHPFMVVVR